MPPARALRGAARLHRAHLCGLAHRREVEAALAEGALHALVRRGQGVGPPRIARRARRAAAGAAGARRAG